MVISLILISCFGSYGCAINPVSGKSQLMLVSEDQEIRMGKEAAPSLNWDFGGEYKDPLLHEYLQGIVTHIWNVSERSKLPFTFYVQNTSLPNAFALPGYVAMTRGLLVDLENEAQFAAVMGHEVGHVMARHSAARMSRGIFAQVGLGVGGVLLGNTQGADALMALGSVGTSLLLLKYDRSQELESDRLGVAYASRLGYDPREAVAAHQRLEAAVNTYLQRAGKTSRSGGFLDELLSTHPRKEVRLEEIQQMIDDLPPYRLKGDGKFSAVFMNMTGRIRTVHASYLVYDDAERALEKKNYDEAESLLRKAIDMQPEQAPFYTLQGRIMLAKNQPESASRLFDKSLSLDHGYQPALYGLGISEYKRNNFTKALEYIRKSLSLFPQHPGSLYAAGLCCHALNQSQDALAYFGSFAQSVESHPEVYGYMGMNYEKISKTDMAVQAYSSQVKIAPDNSMGQYARKRLAVLK